MFDIGRILRSPANRQREKLGFVCGRRSSDQRPRQRGALDPLLAIGPAILRLELTFPAITTQPQAPGAFLGRCRKPARNGGALACSCSLRDPCSAFRHAWAGIGRMVLPALQAATALSALSHHTACRWSLHDPLGDDLSPCPVPCLPTTGYACRSAFPQELHGLWPPIPPLQPTVGQHTPAARLTLRRLWTAPCPMSTEAPTS